MFRNRIVGKTCSLPKNSLEMKIKITPGTEYPRTAMCVRNVDVHVYCSSQVDAQLAAFFIDPRAK
jgi:hypothetical protein